MVCTDLGTPANSVSFINLVLLIVSGHDISWLQGYLLSYLIEYIISSNENCIGYINLCI